VGTSDFNFYEWGRAMGLKMPDLAGVGILPTIQPTMSVGDFSNLTPVHAPPTAHTGGNTAGPIALEFPFFQIQSLARGGTVILGLALLVDVFTARFGTFATPRTPNTVIAPNAIWSTDTPLAVVSVGSDLVRQLLPDGEFPFIEGPGNNGVFPMGGSLWLPPGRVLYVENAIVNTSMSFNILHADVPSSEGGE